MSGLTAAQVSELRLELDRTLARLKESMRMSGQALATVDLDQTTVGRLSRIDSLQNQEMAKSLHERELLKLAAIEQALSRIGDGSYGSCLNCGGEIAFGRLMIFPEASNCTGCGDS